METSFIESSAKSRKKRRETGHPTLRHYFTSRRRYLVVKRAIDISAAMSITLLIFPWLFPIIILAVALDSRGPIFFKQKRVGFLGKTFWCYKFRTMRINDTADSLQAIRNDPRITRTGRILRATGLDEMPQFFNVLMGHMSIVGPRPHMLKDSREFSEVVANYKFRNLARPGITGMSQVRGCRGPAVTFASIFKRYQWDAYYVRNLNFSLDLRIMAETAWLIIRSLFKKEDALPQETTVFEHYADRPIDLLGSKPVIAD